MNGDFAFQKDFIDSLELLRRDVDKALVYAAHALFSDAIRHEKKQALCDDLAHLGKELSASISKFDPKEITQYNVREKEKAFEDDAKSLHGDFEAFAAKHEKNRDIVIDKNMPFDVRDIAEKLSSPKLYAEFSFTKDKVDKLLSVRKLIEEIYRNATADSAERERKLDRQFVELKEKAFNESLRSPKNRNQIYFFRSVALLNKLIADGSSARIVNDDRPLEGNDVGFSIHGEDRIAILYRYGGLSIELGVSRQRSERFVKYAVKGFIEKALSKVEFSIDENVSSGGTASFERVTGLDALWSRYEKAYAEFQRSTRDSGNRQEQLDKEIVDKAIDDLLFD
ncbi:MAG TPA: hypothetical protein VMV90_14785 [Rectinemataceae bacterium]|nr:hypothetical protein [Rectinemataceae bacterium]